jgi:hypothetical protein
MDQENFMLKARSVLGKTARAVRQAFDTLEAIETDDVLSSQYLGSDGDETMTIENTQTPETPINKLRRETFEAISRLSYNRSAEQAEQFFDGLDWNELPMNRGRAIQEFFGNPYLPYPDVPTSALLMQESVQARVADMKEINALISKLHSEIMAQKSTIKKPMTRLEAEALSLERTKSETVRDVAALSGLPRSRIEYLLGRLLTMTGDQRRRTMRQEFAKPETQIILPRRVPTRNDGRDGQPFTVTFKSREPNPFETIPIPERTFAYLGLPTKEWKIFRLIENYLAEVSRFKEMATRRKRHIETLRAQLAQAELEAMKG